MGSLTVGIRLLSTAGLCLGASRLLQNGQNDSTYNKALAGVFALNALRPFAEPRLKKRLSEWQINCIFGGATFFMIGFGGYLAGIPARVNLLASCLLTTLQIGVHKLAVSSQHPSSQKTVEKQKRRFANLISLLQIQETQVGITSVTKKLCTLWQKMLSNEETRKIVEDALTFSHWRDVLTFWIFSEGKSAREQTIDLCQKIKNKSIQVSIAHLIVNASRRDVPFSDLPERLKQMLSTEKHQFEVLLEQQDFENAFAACTKIKKKHSEEAYELFLQYINFGMSESVNLDLVRGLVPQLPKQARSDDLVLKCALSCLRLGNKFAAEQVATHLRIEAHQKEFQEALQLSFPSSEPSHISGNFGPNSGAGVSLSSSDDGMEHPLALSEKKKDSPAPREKEREKMKEDASLSNSTEELVEEFEDDEYLYIFFQELPKVQQRLDTNFADGLTPQAHLDLIFKAELDDSALCEWSLVYFSKGYHKESLAIYQEIKTEDMRKTTKRGLMYLCGSQKVYPLPEGMHRIIQDDFPSIEIYFRYFLDRYRDLETAEKILDDFSSSNGIDYFRLLVIRLYMEGDTKNLEKAEGLISKLIDESIKADVQKRLLEARGQLSV